MTDSIIAARTRERLAATTPSETLAQLRGQLLRDQARVAAELKKRMGGDMSDVDLAFAADATHARKRGFE